MDIPSWLKHVWTRVVDPRRSVTFPVACYPVVVELGGGTPPRVSVGPENMDLPYSRDVLGRRYPGTQAEVAAFAAFWLTQPAFDKMVGMRSLGAITLMFRVWQALNGPRDKHGRIRIPVQCCAVTSDLHQCGNPTRSPSGFCRYHSRPDQRSIWNTVWTCDYAVGFADPPANEAHEAPLACFLGEDAC